MLRVDWRRISLLAILALAAVLRFTQLSAADVISDEALVAFRSIGYIDYLASPNQPTTWERFDGPVPAWAFLSFHDHPPLTFAVQFALFKIFGVSSFALRLPFALVGLASVALAYLITRRLFHDTAALAAALLVAVATPTVWISRLGLQESLVIFFSLLAVYWYRRALDDHRFLPAVGLALGLGLLTKYTIFAVAVPLLVHFFIYRRDYLRLRTFWLGGAIFSLCALPLITYNLMLYRLTGHLDLQLSFLFGQSAPEWQSLPGKAQIGSWPQRIADYWGNLSQMFSPPLLALVLLGLAAFAVLWFASGDPESSYTLLGLLTVSWAGTLLFIGPATRFLAPLSIWLLVIAAVVVTALRTPYQPLRYLLGLFGLGILAYELLFSVQTSLAARPTGVAGIAYSQLLRSDVERWGYAELDRYLAGALAAQRPALQPDVRHVFLNPLQERARKRAEARGDQPTALLMVYDVNLYNLGALWVLHRRLVYDGWPVVTADQFLAQGEDAWRQRGVKEFIFVQQAGDILGEPPEDRTDGAIKLAAQLRRRGVFPGLVSSPRLGVVAFDVYRWGEGVLRGK